ncbi:hypothetical protein PPL_11530, partial [Heterostelium album PN500]
MSTYKTISDLKLEDFINNETFSSKSKQESQDATNLLFHLHNIIHSFYLKNINNLNNKKNLNNINSKDIYNQSDSITINYQTLQYIVNRLCNKKDRDETKGINKILGKGEISVLEVYKKISLENTKKQLKVFIKEYRESKVFQLLPVDQNSNYDTTQVAKQLTTNIVNHLSVQLSNHIRDIMKLYNAAIKELLPDPEIDRKETLRFLIKYNIASILPNKEINKLLADNKLENTDPTENIMRIINNNLDYSTLNLSKLYSFFNGYDFEKLQQMEKGVFTNSWKFFSIGLGSVFFKFQKNIEEIGHQVEFAQLVNSLNQHIEHSNLLQVVKDGKQLLDVLGKQEEPLLVNTSAPRDIKFTNSESHLVIWVRSIFKNISKYGDQNLDKIQKRLSFFIPAAPTSSTTTTATTPTTTTTKVSFFNCNSKNHEALGLAKPTPVVDRYRDSNICNTCQYHGNSRRKENRKDILATDIIKSLGDLKQEDNSKVNQLLVIVKDIIVEVFKSEINDNYNIDTLIEILKIEKENDDPIAATTTTDSTNDSNNNNNLEGSDQPYHPEETTANGFFDILNYFSRMPLPSGSSKDTSASRADQLQDLQMTEKPISPYSLSEGPPDPDVIFVSDHLDSMVHQKRRLNENTIYYDIKSCSWLFVDPSNSKDLSDEQLLSIKVNRIKQILQLGKGTFFLCGIALWKLLRVLITNEE